MTYSSSGPKPYERASKASHHHIINDPAVVDEVKRLYIPPKAADADMKSLTIDFVPQETSITDVVAIDGGYTEAPLREGYPSASIHFFQFGALHFEVEDLVELEGMHHISPEAMQKLRNIERLKLALATKNARRGTASCLRDSVRDSLHDFLSRETLGEAHSLMSTLAWFLFRRYKPVHTDDESQWWLSSNPYGATDGLYLREQEMSSTFKFVCPATGRDIFLCDVFRLHERIDEETGAAGVTAYIAGVIEHLILLHIIRFLLVKDTGALKQVLFIMDRPTGWFGVTAPLHKPMLDLTRWLFEAHNFFMAGLEKSGAFVEHASEIREVMKAGSILVLGDDYIYKYISPGEQDPNRPYAATSYYGTKVIFKTRQGGMYVVSLPVRERCKSPKEADIPNLHAVLTHVEQLRCDIYENALLPVALANKLVSLSAHPSSQILKAFAKSNVS